MSWAELYHVRHLVARYSISLCNGNLGLFKPFTLSSFRKNNVIMSSYSLCDKRILVEIKMDVKIIPFEPHRESMSNTIHSTVARGKILTSHLYIMKCLRILKRQIIIFLLIFVLSSLNQANRC